MSIPPSSHACPSSWDTTSRTANSRHLQVQGLRVKYTGPGTQDKDAASVRANYPVPRDCGLFYFEVTIVNKGRDGFIGIGFSTIDVKLDRLPGWESHSYGYHGDDGHKFNGSGAGNIYGPIYTTGDVIGVIYNRAEQTISYTKNGIDLGVAFTDVHEDRMYPTVGMRTPEEEILANFTGPFKGDLSALGSEAVSRITSKLHKTPIPSRGKKGDLAGELIFRYLLHNGHWQTAATVARDILDGAMQVTSYDKNEMQARQHICQCVLDGKIDNAIASAEELSPGCLEDNPAMLFKLQCQKFMEMVVQGSVEEAIAYGRNVLAAAKRDSQEERELLEDALTVIAYDDPMACPSGHLLQREYKTELAAQLNSCVLRHQGRPQLSELESIWRQLIVIQQELRQCGNPSAVLLDISKILALKS